GRRSFDRRPLLPDPRGPPPRATFGSSPWGIGAGDPGRPRIPRSSRSGRRGPGLFRGPGRLRPFRPERRVGARRTLRALHLVYAVPTGAVPGRPAGALRVPVDGVRAHGARRLQRV